MKCEQCTAELNRNGSAYWLASGVVDGRTLIVESGTRRDAIRDWTVMAYARNVVCLHPKRRYSVELLP
jgi:hypothetical protein